MTSPSNESEKEWWREYIKGEWADQEDEDGGQGYTECDIETAIPAILREERRRCLKTYTASDAACWWHVLMWLLEQEGDIRALAEEKIKELEKELDL